MIRNGQGLQTSGGSFQRTLVHVDMAIHTYTHIYIYIYTMASIVDLCNEKPCSDATGLCMHSRHSIRPRRWISAIICSSHTARAL